MKGLQAFPAAGCERRRHPVDLLYAPRRWEQFLAMKRLLEKTSVKSQAA
jgi:hypothetical protein